MRLLYYCLGAILITTITNFQPVTAEENSPSPTNQSSSVLQLPSLKDGNLIRGSKPDIYIMSSGKRRLVPDEATLKALGYKADNVMQLTDQQLQSIPELPAFNSITKTSYKNGTLIKGSGPSVYIISSGGRRLIPNESTFNSLGYKWENIQNVSDREIEIIPELAALPSYSTKYPEGSLIKGSGPAVYVIEGGRRRMIPDEITFNVLGYQWDKVQNLADPELNAIAIAEPIPSRLAANTLKDGTLIKGSGAAVYVITLGRRRLIPNEATFNALGYQWDKIQTVSDKLLKSIPELPPLPAY